MATFSSILQTILFRNSGDSVFPAAGPKKTRRKFCRRLRHELKPIFLLVKRNGNGSSPIFIPDFPVFFLSVKWSLLLIVSWQFFPSGPPAGLSKIAHLSPTPPLRQQQGLDPPNTPKRLYRNMATAGRFSNPEPILLSYQHTLSLLSHLEKMVDIKCRRKCVQRCRIASS